MALTMILPSFLSLLHLLAGVCIAEVEGDDPINLETKIYTNPYPIANWTDNKVIVALAQKAQCMSYIGVEETPLQSLASCELYCSMNGACNTWDCIAPNASRSMTDWGNTFTDEVLFQWSPGTCSCSNSSSPTLSVFGDEDYDDSSPARFPNQPAVKVADREVRDLSTYGYRVRQDNAAVLYSVPDWNFWVIEYLNSDSAWGRIGIFGVMNNGFNDCVLRIHEIWASRDTRPAGQRAAFHDDVMSFWRLTPLFRHLGYITEIRFDTVIEDSMANIMAWVYQTMGADIMEPLRVFRNGQAPNENQVFEAVLRRTRFARGMQRAIREYIEFSHRTIEGFYWTAGIPGADFAIYFNGYNPATIGDETWNWG